ncbi:MAG: DUF2497 domain-containing protein [Hyphomicrobiales bacterium]|nr:DUF2497 domain-containing protein [Hyphomicrobiales bacterium]MDE2115053.1 DUF2497 domain-containing protein [Hyphomicrobiales bacterium]
MSSASNPVSQPGVSALDVERRELRTQEQKAHEPSMEEILASIRRIIADDKALPIARKGATSLLSEKAQHLAAMQNLAHAGTDKASTDSKTELLTPAPGIASPQILSPSSHSLSVPAQPVPAQPVPAHPVPASEPAALASPVPETISAAIEPPASEFPALAPAMPESQPGITGEHRVPVHDEAFQFESEESDAIFDLAQMPQLRAVQTPRVPTGADTAAALGLNAILQGGEQAFAPNALANAAPSTGGEPLASPFTDASVASSFDALSKSMMLNNKTLIEDLTREMLRPMLKSWLDDNLPVMVERLVRAEIERVARGGRG